jgi:serpin B
VAANEKGTEAAAATAVIMDLVMAPMFEVSLTVDRPFIFLIRDKVSGQILFMGRVVNPSQ